MPTCTVKSCCFLMTLRGGAILIGIISLVFNLLLTIVLVAMAIDDEDRRVLLALGAGCSVLLCVSACFLLHGAHKLVPTHVKCWCVTNLGALVLGSLMCIGIGVYRCVFRKNIRHGWYWFLGPLVAVALSYFVICVYSYGIALRKQLYTQPRQWDKEHMYVDPYY